MDYLWAKTEWSKKGAMTRSWGKSPRSRGNSKKKKKTSLEAGLWQVQEQRKFEEGHVGSWQNLFCVWWKAVKEFWAGTDMIWYILSKDHSGCCAENRMGWGKEKRQRNQSGDYLRWKMMTVYTTVSGVRWWREMLTRYILRYSKQHLLILKIRTYEREIKDEF